MGTQINIVDGKAQVTETKSTVTLYELEELEHEIQAIQNDIDRLEEKKQKAQDIINAFDK